MLLKEPPRFWTDLAMDELYRHQSAVALHMAGSKSFDEKTFYAEVFLDISLTIVAKQLGIKVTEVR